MCVLRLALFLLCLTPPLVAQNSEAYLKLTPQQQDSAVRSLATKAIAVFTAPRPASLSIEQLRLYELHRAFGNFITVLFLTDPAHPDVELSIYTQIRAIEVKNFELSSNEDLGHVVGVYLEGTFRSLDENGGRLTAAFPRLSTMSDSEQVLFLRQLYDQRNGEIADDASKQMEKDKHLSLTRPNMPTVRESSALSSDDQNRSLTVEEVKAMPDQQRAEYLHGFILRAETALVAARDKATTQQDRKSQQLALSITVALFGGPEEGWGEHHRESWNLPLGIEAVLRGAAASDQKQPLGSFVAAYVEHRYAELQQHPAISWLPQQDQFYQEAFSRMVFAAPPLASFDCKTMESDMLRGSQEALVERAATNYFKKLTGSANETAPAAKVQTARRTANLLGVLFFGDGTSTAAPPTIYEDATCYGDSGPFLDHVSRVFSLQVENMTPWVRAADSDADQQNDFRYLVAFDRIHGSKTNSWFAEYATADLHRAVTNEMVKLAVENLRLDALIQAARTVTLYNDGRPSVSGADKLEAQLKPLEDMMPGFDAATKRVLDESVHPFVSPIDKAGRHKQSSEALVERQRGDKILAIVSSKYSEKIANQIYTTYRQTGTLNFDEIFRNYINQELSKE